MSNPVQRAPLPYALLDFLRNYKPKFRERVLKHWLQQTESRSSETLAIEDVLTCIGDAFEEFLEEAENYACPPPDADTVRLSMTAIANGRTQPIQDIINGLQGRSS